MVGSALEHDENKKIDRYKGSAGYMVLSAVMTSVSCWWHRQRLNSGNLSSVLSCLLSLRAWWREEAVAMGSPGWFTLKGRRYLFV